MGIVKAEIGGKYEATRVEEKAGRGRADMYIRTSCRLLARWDQEWEKQIKSSPVLAFRRYDEDK